VDFTDAESRVIGMMMKASKTLPDDFWAVAAVQVLACLFVKIEPLLTDEQASELIGLGGYIAAVGKDEMKAEIGMRVALAKAGFGNDRKAV
jgi:predicted amino acid dehydrogenase